MKQKQWQWIQHIFPFRAFTTGKDDPYKIDIAPSKYCCRQVGIFMLVDSPCKYKYFLIENIFITERLELEGTWSIIQLQPSCHEHGAHPPERVPGKSQTKPPPHGLRNGHHMSKGGTETTQHNYEVLDIHLPI